MSDRIAVTESTPAVRVDRDVPDLEANKAIALRFIEGVFIDQDPKAQPDSSRTSSRSRSTGSSPTSRRSSRRSAT